MIDSLTQGRYASINHQQALIALSLKDNAPAMQTLNAIQGLPNAWMGAGIIFQNLWNLQHGYPLNQHVKDIDILYFDDSDLSYQAEDRIIQQLQQTLKHLPLAIDVKNVARIHLWYQQRFGQQISPYLGVEQSIASWPVLGACLAARLQHHTIEFCAPHGFSDALAMIVRPNQRLNSPEVYQAKANRWAQQWPLLKVYPWVELTTQASAE